MTSMKREPVRLSHEELFDLMKSIPEWSLINDTIEREIKFTTFMEAIDFVNKVAQLADERDHHPDICIYYNKVHLTLSTHKVGGLSELDFELASAIDNLIKK